MRRAEALFLVAWVCAAFASGRASAAEPEISDDRPGVSGETFVVRADEVSYDQNRDLYEAAGRVRVVQTGGRTLSADWLAFNRTTQVGIATGHVDRNTSKHTARAPSQSEPAR